MSNSRRWREFMEFWREMAPKAHLYEASVLATIITEKIKKIQRGSR